MADQRYPACFHQPQCARQATSDRCGLFSPADLHKVQPAGEAFGGVAAQLARYGIEVSEGVCD